MFNFLKSDKDQKALCLNLAFPHDDPADLQKHYNDGLNYAVKAYNGFLKSNVVTGKKWISKNDDKTCEVCRKNYNAGAIPVKNKFPSGHLYPPAGLGCRCYLDEVTM